MYVPVLLDMKPVAFYEHQISFQLCKYIEETEKSIFVTGYINEENGDTTTNIVSIKR